MNPFVYNSPVRGADFFNREKTTERILRETVQGKTQGNVWITGERQVGKTSLLRHIQNFNETNKQTVLPYGCNSKLDVAFIYVNVQGCRHEEDFYNTLWHGMKDFFDFKVEPQDTAYFNFIDLIDKAYNKSKYYVVFLIDEFDAFIETMSLNEQKEEVIIFLARLNSLLQEVSEIKNNPKAFSCVFTANHDLNEMLTENGVDIRGSGLILEAITIKWFTEKQVGDLVKHYLKGSKVQLTEDDIKLCFKNTSGYPYFTQKYLSLMYDIRAKYPDISKRDFEKRVKSSLGRMFHETIIDWGGEKIPVRTLKKLKMLARRMELDQRFFNIIFGFLQSFLNSKFANL